MLCCWVLVLWTKIKGNRKTTVLQQHKVSRNNCGTKELATYTNAVAVPLQNKTKLATYYPVASLLPSLSPVLHPQKSSKAQPKKIKLTKHSRLRYLPWTFCIRSHARLQDQGLGSTRYSADLLSLTVGRAGQGARSRRRTIPRRGTALPAPPPSSQSARYTTGRIEASG